MLAQGVSDPYCRFIPLLRLQASLFNIVPS
jgi:hypothetical protein